MNSYKELVMSIASNTTSKIKIREGLTEQHFLNACRDFQHDFSGWIEDTFYLSHGNLLFRLSPLAPFYREGMKIKSCSEPIAGLSRPVIVEHVPDEEVFWKTVFTKLPINYFTDVMGDIVWSQDKYLEIMLMDFYNQLRDEDRTPWSQEDARAMIVAHADKAIQYFEEWEDEGVHPHRATLLYMIGHTEIMSGPGHKRKDWVVDMYQHAYGLKIEQLEQEKGLFRIYDAVINP